MSRRSLHPHLAVALCMLVTALVVCSSHTRVAQADPSLIGQWSAPFATPNLAVHVVLLRTGDVLMWDAFAYGHEAYLWNSATGAFTYVPSASNIFCAAPALLANGQALVVGGHLSGGVGLPDVNLFDPITKSWIAAAPMAYPRWYPNATTLPDGRVLVVSGSTSCFTCVAEIPELYDPTTNTWTQLSNARLSMPLYPHMYVLPDGRILYASATEGATTTQTLDLGTQTWTMIDPVPVPGGSSAMYRPGVILKAGSPGAPGRLPAVPSLDTAYVLDMNQPAPAWRSVGRMAFPRTYHTLTILPDGHVLTTSGSQGTEPDTAPVYAAELWNPQTEVWTTLASAQIARTYHQTALLLPDGRVLVAGSGGCCGAPDQYNAEIFSPPYLFKGPRPSLTSAPATVPYGAPFFVGTPDAGTIGAVVLIRYGAATHQVDRSQHYVPLAFTPAANGLTVQMPANANLAPPGDYMLFLVTTNGVPSLAPLVRVAFTTQDLQPPTAPATLTAAGLLGQVNLSWTAATDNVGVVHYNVHRSTSPGVTPSPANRIAQPTATSHTDAGLAAGTYYYVVTAQDFAGNVGPPSNEAGATVTPGIAGLVAAYPFNEGSGTTAADASGHGRTVALVGGPTWGPGQFGNALTFDGVNDYGVVPTLFPSLPAWTISAWVRSPAAPSTGAASGPLHREANFQFNWNHPDPAFRGAAAGNLGGTWYAASFGPLAANTWYFLAATYDGETLNAYTNGGLVTSNPAPAGPAVSDPNPPTFGKHAALSQFFQGTVDEVRIYDHALSAADIQIDMQTPIVTFTVPPTVTTNAATGVEQTRATLNGTVNPNGSAVTASFQWGTTTAYGNTTSSQSIGSGTTNVSVSANLTGLAASTPYHYRVMASNSAGTTFGADVVFTTSATHTLTVASVNPSSGVGITVSPVDNGGLGNGTTPLSRVYDHNALVNLTAPAAAGANTFQKWQRDGVDVSTSTGVQVTVDANHMLTAVYVVASFGDVPSSYIFWPWIDALVRAGITGGCGTNPPIYCPDQTVTRAQMAVFLSRGIHGAGYTPPAASGIFADVALNDPLAAWIERLFAEGITAGCGTNPLRYCPDQGVTRGEMAVFLLRGKHGAAYQPPAATGIFADVPLDHPFARWIQQLFREGTTGGCGTSPARYCPDQPVTRGQIAVFLVRTFNLPM